MKLRAALNVVIMIFPTVSKAVDSPSKATLKVKEICNYAFAETAEDQTSEQLTQLLASLTRAELRELTPDVLLLAPAEPTLRVPFIKGEAGSEHDVVGLLSYLKVFGRNPASLKSILEKHFAINKDQPFSNREMDIDANTQLALDLLLVKILHETPINGTEIVNQDTTSLGNDQVQSFANIIAHIETPKLKDPVQRLAAQKIARKAGLLMYFGSLKADPAGQRFVQRYVDAIAMSPAREAILSDPSTLFILHRMMRWGNLISRGGTHIGASYSEENAFFSIRQERTMGKAETPSPYVFVELMQQYGAATYDNVPRSLTSVERLNTKNKVAKELRQRVNMLARDFLETSFSPNEQKLKAALLQRFIEYPESNFANDGFINSFPSNFDPDLYALLH